MTKLPLILLVIAAACLVYGAWAIYPPAGWIVAGVLLAFAGVLSVERKP